MSTRRPGICAAGAQVRCGAVAWGKACVTGPVEGAALFPRSGGDRPAAAISPLHYGKAGVSPDSLPAALRYGSAEKTGRGAGCHPCDTVEAPANGGAEKAVPLFPCGTHPRLDVSIPYEHGRLARLRTLCAQADAIVAVSSLWSEMVGAMSAKSPPPPLSGCHSDWISSPAFPTDCRKSPLHHTGGPSDQAKAVSTTIEALQRSGNRYGRHSDHRGSGPERGAWRPVQNPAHFPWVRFWSDPQCWVLEGWQIQFFILPTCGGFRDRISGSPGPPLLHIGTRKERGLRISSETGKTDIGPPDSPSPSHRLLHCLDIRKNPRGSSARTSGCKKQTWEENARHICVYFQSL